MKKILTTSLLVIFFAQAFGQDGGPAEKSTCLCQPSGRFLVPYAGGVRVGWVNEGLQPIPYFPASVPQFSPVADFNTTTLTHNRRITNPGLIGGLPSSFPGLSSTTLSGIADCPTCLTPRENIYLSGTMTIGGTQNHYILKANITPSALDFVVSDVYVVSAPFAAASSGWKLHHIEWGGSTSIPPASTTLYGLMTNGTASHLIKIVLTGSFGTATSLYYWPSTCLSTLYGSYPNFKMTHLASSLNILLDVSSGISSSSSIGAIATGSCGGFGYLNYFLGKNYTEAMYVSSPPGVFNFGVAPTATNWYFTTNGSPTIYSSMPLSGQVFTDHTTTTYH